MKQSFLLIFLFCFSINHLSYADTLTTPGATCHGHMINPISDIDWNGIYPITIGSSDMVSGDLPDTDNPGNPICICEWDPWPEVGLAMGYWEPMALVDVTRTPYCLVNLGGKQLKDDTQSEGDVDTISPDQNSSFYYVHYFNYPVMQWIGSWLLGGTCQTDGAFLAPSYFSEIDPTWKDEKLAEVAFPETLWFANPEYALGAQAACAADSLAANTGLPNDISFWCAGSQGFMYPMTGEVAEHEGMVQATTLISERVISKLHQIGLIQDTDAGDLCNERWDYNLKKSRYRYQMIYPNKADAKPFGRTTAIWGAGKDNPVEGDDAGYLIYRKRNCCNY